ncbi:glucooligosaccharide oxidase, partial [Stemphylium lycopersici]
ILVSDSLPSAQYAASTLMALQHLAANASLVDRRLSLGVYYMNTTFIITGIYFGGVAEFRSEILPELLRSAPGYQNLTIEETPWVNASASFESLQHDSFFTSTIILLWGGADSQLSLPAKIDTQYSSFRGYGSLWEIQNMVQSAGMCSDIGEESVKQLTDWRDALLRSQGDHAGAYINHIDPTLDRTTAYRLYYGAERHRRLVALKRRIDPENLFWNPLSITT